MSNQASLLLIAALVLPLGCRPDTKPVDAGQPPSGSCWAADAGCYQDVPNRATSLAGSGATDCGSIDSINGSWEYPDGGLIDGGIQPFFQCALSAQSTNQSFILTETFYGVDGHSTWYWVRTPAGDSVQLFQNYVLPQTSGVAEQTTCAGFGESPDQTKLVCLDAGSTDCACP